MHQSSATRVNPRIGDVDEHVDQEHDGCRDQDDGLDHWIVSGRNGVEQVLPMPGIVKMVSMRMLPPSRAASCRPVTVMTGVSALRTR